MRDPSPPCVGKTDLMYDESREAEAIRLCLSCPILDECRENSLSEKHGVWGGMTPRERGFYLNRRRPRRQGVCGTPAGYKRHWDADETPCNPCRVAMGNYLADRVS